MPWSVKKQNGKFCVVKKGESSPIKGGCHSSRADAVDQMQALYASEAMAAIAESFEDNDDNDEVLEEFELEVETEEEEAPRLLILAAAFDITERTWSGPIAFEELSTGDNRKFGLDAISWDEPPMPLLFQRVSGEGHKGSVVIGRVDHIERRDNAIFAKGVILEGIPEADEFLALLEHEAAGGVSVDGDSAVYTVEEAASQNAQPSIKFTGMRIRGLTAVAIPAFAEASIELDEETEELAKKRKRTKKKSRAYTWSFAEANDALIAAAAPVKPPLEWFANPELDGPTPMTVTPDGYVFGHLALFNTCHVGMPSCTRPPKNCTYAYFHTGEVETEDGTAVAVGHLTFNTGHAGINDPAAVAAAHYDNTGYVGADVVCGEDKWGVWFAGALRPELSDEQVRAFRAAPLSGDWRRISGRMELVAALSVNTPGFPVPRSRALVASGSLDPEVVITMNEETYVMDTKTRMIEKAAMAVRVRAVFEEAQCKTEGGVCYPAGDYAYVPDSNAPSTWKLRLTESPGADPTAAQVGRAVAALGKGFRGNKVEIPADDLAAVKAKVLSAWKATHEDNAEVPAVLASAALAGETVTFNIDHIQTIIGHLNMAVNAFKADDQDAGLRQLDAAEEMLNDVIDSYDNEDYGDEGDGEDYSADTEEFASCTAARKRVRSARRNLRKALRALATCDGPYRVVRVVTTPPASGMSGETIEFVSVEEAIRSLVERVDAVSLQSTVANQIEDVVARVDAILACGAGQHMHVLEAFKHLKLALMDEGEAEMPAPDAPEETY